MNNPCIAIRYYIGTNVENNMESICNMHQSSLSFLCGVQHNSYAEMSYCRVYPTIKEHNWLNNNKAQTPWESFCFYRSTFLQRAAVTYLSLSTLLASLALLIGLLTGWFVGRRQHCIVNRSQHKLLSKNTCAKSGSLVPLLITPSLPGKNDNTSNMTNSSLRRHRCLLW